MKTDTAILYTRVSTKEQGISKLGLDSQKTQILNYARSNGYTITAEYSEVTNGRDDNRVQLAQALQLAKETGAVLIIAKLDRLSRRLSFVARLLEEKGLTIIPVDLGRHADIFTIQLMATIAELEARKISERTSAALQELKKRGVKLGNPNPAHALKLATAARVKKADEHALSVGAMIVELRAKGHVSTLQHLADILNLRGVRSSRGSALRPCTVMRIENRYNALLKAS